MNILRKWKNKLSLNDTKNPKTIFSQLPLEIWERIISFIPEHDVIAFGSSCVWFRRIMQRVKTSFNLEQNYHVNTDCLLNYALSTTCTSLNINHCYWLKSKEILEIISRTKLQHFHLINCDVNEDVMRAIFNLHLKSFSFTYEKVWKNYFEEHREKSSVFLQRLIGLKIIVVDEIRGVHILLKLEYSAKVLFDVYVNVLQYCEELEDLTMSDRDSRYTHYYLPKESLSQFESESRMLLPKLKRLILDLDYHYFERDEFKFLKAILKNKVIPLEHLDLGPLNCTLLQSGIRHHPLILPEKETLYLTFVSYTFVEKRPLDQLFDFLGEEELMYQTSYKKIWLEDIKINKFADFTDKIISNSGKSIQKLYLRNCQVLENILSGIQLFSLNCAHITELDLTIENWLETRGSLFPPPLHCDFDPTEVKCSSYSSVEMEKNEALLEVLTNFKNLKKLWIKSCMLHCLYHSTHDNKIIIKKMPFWKVTTACEQLTELYFRMSRYQHIFSALIHENSLYDIAHCKQLKVLHLERFCIRTNSEFQLSPIAKGCHQLEELRIDWNYVLQDLKPTRQISTLDDSFNFLKNLKRLHVRWDLPIQSTTIVEHLCQCKNLEKLMLTIKGENTIQSLIDSLPKFEKLYLLSASMDRVSSKLFQFLCSVIQKIHDKKPAFYAVVHGRGDTFETINSRFKLRNYIER